MKRWMSLLIVFVGLAPLSGLAEQESDSALLLVTGAYYDENGRVLVKARPARVEVPVGAPQEDYRLVEGSEQVFELREDAYIAVPSEIPAKGVKLSQARAQDFPIYLSEFKQGMESADHSDTLPDKGDGIPYAEYTLLYQAAVAGDIILSLTYHELD